MKTIAASITLLLIVIIGGMLITRKPEPPQQALPSEQTEVSETETPEGTRAAEWEEELPEYFQVIINNNLFLPLGWKAERKSDTPFQLVGTILKDELEHYQAVLKAVDTQQVYFVTLNEVQDGWRLVMIEPKRVVLEKDNRRITLALNEQHLFISPQPR